MSEGRECLGRTRVREGREGGGRKAGTMAMRICWFGDTIGGCLGAGDVVVAIVVVAPTVARSAWEGR